VTGEVKEKGKEEEGGVNVIIDDIHTKWVSSCRTTQSKISVVSRKFIKVSLTIGKDRRKHFEEG